MNAPHSISVFLLISPLVLSLAGCSRLAPQPAAKTPDLVGAGSSRVIDSSLTPHGIAVQNFFAVMVAGGDDFAGEPARLIIFSTVVDENNLWFGVSRKTKDIRQCWTYQDAQLSGCSTADIERGFYYQAGQSPLPKMFFAIATMDEREALIILDYQHGRSTQDLVDGYRYVLVREGESWQVKSWKQVY